MPKTPTIRHWAPAIECSALLAAFAVLNLVVFPSDPGFVSITPHPTLFIILFLAVRHGFRSAVMAVVMSTVVYGLLLLQLADVPTYLYLLDAPFATPAVVLVPVAVIVGLTSQRHIDRLALVIASSEVLIQENLALRGEHEELRDVNLELAERVVGAEGTVGQLYEFAKQLNVVDEEKIFDGLLQLLGESLGAELSTIWRVGSDGSSAHELLASSVDKDGELSAPDCVRHMQRFDNRGVLALHDVPEPERTPELPFLLGKLTRGSEGSLIAYVAVNALPFPRYTDEGIRLFRMIVEWASTSLGNVSAATSEISKNLSKPKTAFLSRTPTLMIPNAHEPSGSAPITAQMKAQSTASPPTRLTTPMFAQEPTSDRPLSKEPTLKGTSNEHTADPPPDLNPALNPSMTTESVIEEATLERSVDDMEKLRELMVQSKQEDNVILPGQAIAPANFSTAPATIMQDSPFDIKEDEEGPEKKKTAPRTAAHAARVFPSRSVTLLTEMGAKSPGQQPITKPVPTQSSPPESSVTGSPKGKPR